MKTVAVLGFCIHIVVCRDFYVGMFQRDDFLVASDTLYKERRPWTQTMAEYKRILPCNIVYYRVVDRLGSGYGPYVEIVRGGLQKKFIHLRIRSTYNLPLSINIYVGCENKHKHNITRSTHIIRPTRHTRAPRKTRAPNATDTSGNGEKNNGTLTTELAHGNDTATEPSAGSGETTHAEHAESAEAGETTEPAEAAETEEPANR